MNLDGGTRLRRGLELPAFLVTLASAATLEAQGKVQGTVRDSATKAPLARVEVRGNATATIVTTDADGRYELDVPAGNQVIRFRRIGFDSTTRSVSVGDGVVQVDVELRPTAARLDSVRVLTSAAPRVPVEVAERLREGFGTFILDTALRPREHLTTSVVIEQKTTGVRFVREQGRNVAMSRRGGSFTGRCYMAIWINGVQVWTPGEDAGRPGPPATSRSIPPDLDQWAVAGIEAIEVFSPAQMPSRYRGTGAACGVIALWLRTR